tara:strand:- start:170 stop:640 length:471 start_codon:yes stop_codon:yes gene_type:complete
MNVITQQSKYVAQQLAANVPHLRSITSAPRSQFNLQSVPLEIMSSASIPQKSYQWKYTVRIAQLDQANHSWTDIDVQGFPFAFNGWEAGNTATSVKVLGPGNPANLPSGFSVEPLPDGLITWGHVQYFADADASTSIDEWCFFLINQPNPVAGACS